MYDVQFLKENLCPADNVLQNIVLAVLLSIASE